MSGDPVLWIEGSAWAAAAARVHALLLGREAAAVDGSGSGRFPVERESRIFLAEHQIQMLARWRARGFAGPAVVLSGRTLRDLVASHDWLTAGGRDSLASFQPGATVVQMLSRFDELQGISPGNLRLLQVAITHAARHLRRVVLPALICVERGLPGTPQAIQALAESIVDLNSLALRECHSKMQTQDGPVRIDERLRSLVDRMRRAETAAEVRVIATALREALEALRVLLVDLEDSES